MARLHSVMLAALCLTLTACAGSPTGPSSTTTTPRAPLAVTGQSQVELFEPPLAALYHGPVVGVWEGGKSIAYWSPVDRLWAALVPSLHQSLAAFVFAQGESDCDGLSTAVSDYGPRFADLMRRVRLEANAPTLPILVVTVSPTENCAAVRGIQAAWVAQDAHARLISSDDLPRRDFPADIHLTDAGARLLAERIIAALP